MNAGPLVCDAATNVVPAGTTSFSATVAASEGPLFVTVTAYVTLVPASAVAGALLVIETSAWEEIVVLAVALSFDGFESTLEVVAVAELLTTVPFGTPAAARTPIVNCALCPLVSSEIVHNTLPPAPGEGVEQLANGPVS